MTGPGQYGEGDKFLGTKGIAAGWLLRDAGKRDETRLRQWIVINASRMPRTMLRYSIEKFPDEERKYLSGVKSLKK